MIAEIRIRYAVHALLLGLAMFSAVMPFWFPWFVKFDDYERRSDLPRLSTNALLLLNRFYVVKEREGISYTSLWKIESIRTIEMSREQVISTTTVRSQNAL